MKKPWLAWLIRVLLLTPATVLGSLLLLQDYSPALTGTGLLADAFCILLSFILLVGIGAALFAPAPLSDWAVVTASFAGTTLSLAVLATALSPQDKDGLAVLLATAALIASLANLYLCRVVFGKVELAGGR